MKHKSSCWDLGCREESDLLPNSFGKLDTGQAALGLEIIPGFFKCMNTIDNPNNMLLCQTWNWQRSFKGPWDSFGEIVLIFSKIAEKVLHCYIFTSVDFNRLVSGSRVMALRMGIGNELECSPSIDYSEKQMGTTLLELPRHLFQQTSSVVPWLWFSMKELASEAFYSTC